MQTDLWKINGQTPAAIGLSGLVLTYASLSADALTLTHASAAWDADPLWAYGATVTLTRGEVVVFTGKVRRTPRFLGTQAESAAYEIAGPWDWLERRALLQNVAVVLDPEASSVPALLPQGLVILGQSDAGTTVNLAAALAAVLASAPAAGVAVDIGDGFDYPVVWDEVADLTVADAVVRLLGTAPDAVSSIDYTTSPAPTLRIRRRANLAAVTLAVAPAGEGGGAAYAPLESVRVIERPDLVPSGVHILYRRIDTIGGDPYLRLATDSAGPGAPGDENALVRTVELVGASYSASVLEQAVKVAPLSPFLTTSGTITAASDAAAFLALGKFWKRKVGWLGGAGVTITGFRGCARVLTAAAGTVDGEGAELAAETLDTTLNNELIEGAIAPWMESGSLNRKAQDQTYLAEVVAEVVVDGVTTTRTERLTAGVLATNCTTRSYRTAASSAGTVAELTPVGVAAQLWAALSVLPVEGSCGLLEEECTLTLRPGEVLQLTGGRAGWATMRALVQRTVAQIDLGQTEVTYGPPGQLGPMDLVDLMRANRLKRPATRAGWRATGTL